MSSLNRTISRTKKNKNNQAKKAKAQKKLEDKVMMFDKMPTQCSVCSKQFDKTSRDHAMSWRIYVNEKDGRVSLFCPECINKVEEKWQNLSHGSKNQEKEEQI